MFGKKFLALCVLACLALGANGVKAQEANVELLQDMDVDIRKIDIEHYDGIIDAIAEYLKDFFAQVTKNCLRDVAKNCKIIWYNPKKLVKCAKEYFKEHEGECAILDTLDYETMLMSIYSEDNIKDVDLDITKIDIENYNEIIDAIIHYLKDFLQRAIRNCLKEVVKNCKKVWYDPKKLFNCTKEYFKEHLGECAIPNSLQYETLLMSIPSDKNDVRDIDIRQLDIEKYDKIIDAIIAYLKEDTTNCLKEMAKNCKKIGYNPKELLKCAKEYFKEHESECAIPDKFEYETMLANIYNENGDEDTALELHKIDIENLLMTIDNDTELTDSIETRNPALQIIIKLLVAIFKWAVKNCIKEVTNNCKSHWNNIPAFIDCTGKFFKDNKGRCAFG